MPMLAAFRPLSVRQCLWLCLCLCLHLSVYGLDLKQRVVIVGAGPAGLCSALMLRQHGWKDITIIEGRPLSSFESEKAYLYLITDRGQRITDLLGVTGAIAKRAVSSFQFTSLKEVLTTGEVRTKKLPVTNAASEKYWLPRSALLDVLLKRVQEVNQNTENTDTPIKLMFDTQCRSISHLDGKIVIKTHCTGKDLRYDELQCDFLLGCDGLNSVVRNHLSSGEVDFSSSNRAVQGAGSMQSTGDTLSPSPSQSQSPPLAGAAPFRMVKYASDAAGLRYKMLTLQNRFPLPREQAQGGQAQGTGEQAQAGYEPSTPETGYAIRSTGTTRSTRFSFGLLPVLGDTPRSANVICLPEHEIWGKKDAASLRAYLEKQMPQMNISDLFAEEELHRFASSSGGVFPPPQHCSALQAVFLPTPTPTTPTGELGTPVKEGEGAGGEGAVGAGGAGGSAVVLLGDCIHAFPPDLGQGVNAALDDVFCLHESLTQSHNDIALALPIYEKQRAPESAALCRLMTFGYPYQYGHMPLRGKLCLMNFALRLGLNKLLPPLVSPPAFYMIQFSNLSYQEILHRAHRTTRLLLASLALLLAPLLRSLWPLLRRAL